MLDKRFHDWRDAGGKPRPLAPGQKPGIQPVKPPPPPPPADQGVSRPTKPQGPADAAQIDPASTAIQPGAKQILKAFEPQDGDTAAPAGETFSSKGLKLPAEPGTYGVMKSREGDFEVQVARAEGATSAIAIKANAKGDVVKLAADGQGTINGMPLPGGDTPLTLANGGTVTNFGAGMVTIDSAGGDTVTAFAKGDRVDFMGQLSELRGPGAIAAPERVTEAASLVR